MTILISEPFSVLVVHRPPIISRKLLKRNENSEGNSIFQNYNATGPDVYISATVPDVLEEYKC